MPSKLKIAVTGAGGFLGTETTRFLLACENVKEVRTLWSKGRVDAFLGSKARHKTLVGDLRETQVCETLVRGADLVMHFANRGYPNDSAHAQAGLVNENLVATRTLLEAMKKAGVRRILYPSSGGALYRRTPEVREPFSETSPIEFRSQYAAGKFQTETLLEQYRQRHGLSPIILRISNPYGPAQVTERRQGFIGVLFSSLLKNTPMTIWGSLDTFKDFIYIKDLLRVFERLLCSPDLTGIFNVGSGKPTSLREVVAVAEHVSQQKLLLQFQEGRPGDSPWTALNASKIHKALSWSCLFPLETGMREIWTLIQRKQAPQESRSERIAA